MILWMFGVFLVLVLWGIFCFGLVFVFKVLELLQETKTDYLIYTLIFLCIKTQHIEKQKFYCGK